MEHAYLEELENPYRIMSVFNTYDNRQERWKKQQEIYGFDDSDTWCLQASFYSWLYERLRMFVEIGGKTVDLTYHKFGFKGGSYTQLEMIEMILERIRFYFSDEYDDFNADQMRYVEEIGELWAIILPAMWW